MPSFPFRKRINEAGDITGVVCYHRDLPAVIRTGYKETSEFKVCEKLSGFEKDLLAVCEYGGGDDRGIYAGKSRKTEIRKTV